MHVGFVMKELILGHIVSEYFSFYLTVSSYKCCTFIFLARGGRGWTLGHENVQETGNSDGSTCQQRATLLQAVFSDNLKL
jgi:hypothetical protein